MPKRNKVKPTSKQRIAFENIERGMKRRDAMLAAGYGEVTSSNAKQNLVKSRGYQELIEEYRGCLRNAGVTPDVLSEVQAEGLFDQDARVRLEYLKENKKDLGLTETETTFNQQNIQINVHPAFLEKYGTIQSPSGATGSNKE